MNRGGKTAILLAVTTLCGCTSASQVNVRPIADPAAKFREGSADVAAARGQLALGNVGLALEAFRIIQRNRPNDPAALAGIGDCYAAMGRFDLAQSNFEAALALAPHSPTLLLGLARIFEREGDPARALAVRAEAQSAASAAAPTTIAASRPAAPAQQIVSAKYASSVTVALPQARPADRLSSMASAGRARLAQAAVTAPIASPPPVIPAQVQSVVLQQATPQTAQSAPAIPLRSSITVALPQARPAHRLSHDATSDQAQLTQAAITAPIGWAPPSAVLETGPAAALTVAMQAAEAAPSMPHRSSIAVALPLTQRAERLSTRGAQAELTRAAATVPLAPAITVPLPPARPAEPDRPVPRSTTPAVLTEATGPRIERMSSGEVMLVTTGRSPWRPQGAPQVLASAAVRWIPLGNAAVTPNVQVVNAARRQGIARSARTVLLDRGWRRIAVGDATEIRQKSVVLYPKNRSSLGRSLARQFGIASRESNGDRLVLVLGQDAVELVRSQQKS